MPKTRKIYIGVAWPYVNDLFHLGNLSGAYLAPDIFRRFHEISGNETIMISGSDFHGTPTTIRAEKEGVAPLVVANRYHKLDKEYLKKFRIDYSLYTSTHTKNHFEVTQKMFLALLKNGYIKTLKTNQLYSQKSAKFLQDRYVEGECSYCHAKDARGDQCEKCGRALDALELINPISKIDNSPLIAKETENYFLDLKKLNPVIKKWLKAKTDWRCWVKSEAMGWLNDGLKPRAITRDLYYGVALPVGQIPEELRIENIKDKCFYVWFEAVIGYLSGAIEYSKKIGKPDYWKKFFYGKGGETYYFVGQDNLVFHTINWPAQLYAFDKKINLPTNVFVNKFLLLEGEKMSKSRNWFLDSRELLKNYSADSLRFYLGLNMAEAKEFSFSWADFVAANNNILVGTIGNFIHRVLVFSQKHFGEKFTFDKKEVSPLVKKEIEDVFKKTGRLLDRGGFRDSLATIVSLASFGNKFFNDQKPWVLINQDKKRVKKAINDCLALVFNLNLLLWPFIPESAEELSWLLGQRKPKGEISKNQWQFSLPAKIVLSKTIKPLFAKIPEEKIKEELAKLNKTN